VAGKFFFAHQPTVLNYIASGGQHGVAQDVVVNKRQLTIPNDIQPLSTKYVCMFFILHGQKNQQEIFSTFFYHVL